MKLKVLAFGLACGIVWALGVFILGIMAIYGWGIAFVEVLSSVYIGLELTVVGILFGVIWAFVDAFIGGAVLAWLYNKISKV